MRKLQNWDEVKAWLAENFKPVNYDPKGHAVYNGTEVAELKEKQNIIYPDERDHKEEMENDLH